MKLDLSLREVDELRHSARMIVRELGLLSDAYFNIGVTLAERHLLIELENSNYPDVGEISEKLLLDKSTASRLIAKSVKKGFIQYAKDENDKRRRCLKLTEKGRKTLMTFEPIAQGQVKAALLTLNQDEIDKVRKGVSLFAKGLKTARMRKEFVLSSIKAEHDVGLSHTIQSYLAEFQCQSLSCYTVGLFEKYCQKGFAYFVIKKGSKVMGGGGFAPIPNNKEKVCELQKIHLDPSVRGLGLGSLLLETCLKEAKKQGYKKCYLESKTSMVQAQKLYHRHGFIPVDKRLVDESSPNCNLFMEKILK